MDRQGQMDQTNNHDISLAMVALASRLDYPGPADDFRDLSDHALEPRDTTFECKNCGKFFQIVMVKRTTMIWLEKVSGIADNHKATPKG